MRIARYCLEGEIALAFYHDDHLVPLGAAALAHEEATGAPAPPDTADVLQVLPGGAWEAEIEAVGLWLEDEADLRRQLALPRSDVQLLAPVPRPPKIFLLAGNYAAHIEEEGKIALERAETFPYVFMKPVTTVNDPDAPIRIPAVSPDHIDYECELGVIIGREAKGVDEADALSYVAGYTVVNDISDRQYKPFPERKPRERDAFFDWQHGKWHDGFFPMGPCVRSSVSLPDPSGLSVSLRVNGEQRQTGSTAQMIFPVAAIVSFLSQSITLEPGDVIATGTPAGVGMTTGRFLKPGDVIEAEVGGIGLLRNTMA
ncbi:MAG: fumarylacetoacetate hydrolase family protein [Candidatus Hydrogenedentes bacterium]|nr:fumarylacetoacetate hydrolase family protein [Candidatus Hydrogenedentota bacterium]